jgi:hypothetical protein
VEVNMSYLERDSFEGRGVWKTRLEMLWIAVVLGVCCFLQTTMAQTPPAASTMTQDELASATGKFAGSAVVGADLVMSGTWQNGQSGQLGAQVRVQINPGASRPLVVTARSQAVDGTSQAGPGGTPGVIDSGVPNVVGVLQGNQIAGFNNTVNNQFEVTILPGNAAPEAAAVSEPGSSHAQSNAGQVDAGLAEGGVVIRIKPASGGGTVQRIGAGGANPGGIAQWAQVPGNDNKVNLMTSLELRTRPLSTGDAISQSARQALSLMPGRTR